MLKIVAENPERLIGFAWIDPLLPNAKNEVERVIVDYRLQGIKMIPNHLYPYEERIFPVYERIEELGLPSEAQEKIMGRNAMRFFKS